MATGDGVPDPPGHLRDLIQRLLSQGFTEIEAVVSPEHFGNVLRVFERKPIRVRVVRDRGDWSAEFTADEWPRHDHFGEDWVFLPPLVSENE